MNTPAATMFGSDPSRAEGDFRDFLQAHADQKLLENYVELPSLDEAEDEEPQLTVSCLGTDYADPS